MGATEEAVAEAQGNPHHPGSMGAAWWDLGKALQALFAPFWDWMEARSVRQFLIAIAGCFAILVVLCAVAGTFVPLAFGFVFWFAGGLFVGKA